MAAVDGVDPVTGKRTLENAQRWLYSHLDEQAHPFGTIAVEPAREVVASLTSTDPQPWADAWVARARAFAASAADSDQRGDAPAAREAWWQAYQFAFMGRYPTPNHPAKQAAYEESIGYFQKAVALDEPAVERIEVPFSDGDREGRNAVAFYVAYPSSEPPAEGYPAVITWAGIDTWKEETYALAAGLRARGIATIHTDMPGVGEAPVFAGVDAERMWEPVLDWIADSPLNAERVGLMGLSFGGYWAMKLAHTHRDRLWAVVNWGGPVHRTFQPEWQERSRSAGSYLMDLMAARARIFDGSTFEDYIARCPELSLVDQGILDGPSSPLLLLNGKDDRQNDATDLLLSLEYGDPKTVRLFPGGHMGEGPVGKVAAGWLLAQLLSASSSPTPATGKAH